MWKFSCIFSPVFRWRGYYLMSLPDDNFCFSVFFRRTKGNGWIPRWLIRSPISILEMYVLIQFTRTHVWQKSVVLSVFFWHSDNLYGLWFVFITECEFDNTEMEWTPSIAWRYVSDKLKYKKHKALLFVNKQRCCLNYIIRTCCHAVFPSSSSLVQ